MRERTLKFAFRLFPWHVGALNACGAFNFAAAPWKFARKLAARPTGSARHGWKIGVFRPCRFLDSGGLGLRTNAFAHFSTLAPLRFVGTTHPHAHLRPTSKATAGSARTRQGTLGSLDPPSAAAPSVERRFFTRRRREPRPSRRSAVSTNFAHTRNASQRSSADHRRADRVAQTRQQLRAGSACQAQAATTAAQRRQFELRPHQKRTPAVKRRPPAR